MTSLLPAIDNSSGKYLSSAGVVGWGEALSKYLAHQQILSHEAAINENGSEATFGLEQDGGSDHDCYVYSDLHSKTAQLWLEQRSKLMRRALQYRSDEMELSGTQIAEVTATGMQKWQGRVVDVDEGTFSVDLVPLDGGPEVTADFDLSLMSDEDQIGVGDFVYVTVRTVDTKKGGKTRTAAVRLRRLGVWTQAEVDDQKRRAKQRATKLASSIE